MKLFLLLSLLCITANAFPLSGRQYDNLVTPSELYVLRVVFAAWQARGGGLIAGPYQSASGMIHVMLGHGRGYGLRPDERRLLRAVDQAVIRRVR